MLRTFLQSYKKSFPPAYNNLIANQAIHPNLIIHHPIEAIPSTHPLTTRIRTAQSSTVPKGVNIFMMSASQSFSNVELIGATVQDRLTVENFFAESASDTEIFENQDLQGLFKILIQIYANESQIRQGEMPLHDLARLLMSQAFHDMNDPTNSTVYKLGLEFDLKKYLKYVRSFHLSNFLKSKQQVFLNMYQVLAKNFVKTTNPNEFANLLQLVRPQLREIHENSRISNLVAGQPNKRVFALAPILPSLTQSYSPNCILVGKYFTHLRQSFYCLETLREIKGGEQLMIPAKKNINNYDKMIRYGYKSIIDNPENPDNEYMLIINLMDPSIPQVAQMLTSGDIDVKRQALSLQNLKMKSFIKISKNGHIKKEDLKMLRILHGVTSEEQLQKERIAVDEKIYNFADLFAGLNLNRHKSQNVGRNEALEEGIDKDIIKSFRIIEEGEIEVLSNFMAVKKRICQK